jgi:hypothetical protein
MQKVKALNTLIPHTRKDLRVVAFDPGETTGVCVFHGSQFVTADQLKTKTLIQGINEIRDFIDANWCDEVVCEDYRVYAYKSDEHKWADLHTPKLIGGIQTICHLRYKDIIPCTFRMASEAKQFVDDEKLQAWGLWGETKGMRHARDAIRHAIFHLVFGK